MVLAVVAALAAAVSSSRVWAGEAGAPVALFGYAEKADANLSQFPKWTGVLERYATERALEDARCVGACPLQRWKTFLARLSGQQRTRQLEAVNQYVNQTTYQSDTARFGVVDHWATPAEFFGRSGDCEDYAIAKYLSLRHLGWPKESLRIVVLNDENRRELHAVLVAYHNGTAYVLDNLGPAVAEHGAIRHYRPIFSINETTWYLHQGWNPSGVAANGATPSWPAAAHHPKPPGAPPMSSTPTVAASQAATDILRQEQYRMH